MFAHTHTPSSLYIVVGLHTHSTYSRLPHAAHTTIYFPTPATGSFCTLPTGVCHLPALLPATHQYCHTVPAAFVSEAWVILPVLVRIFDSWDTFPLPLGTRDRWGLPHTPTLCQPILGMPTTAIPPHRPHPTPGGTVITIHTHARHVVGLRVTTPPLLQPCVLPALPCLPPFFRPAPLPTTLTCDHARCSHTHITHTVPLVPTAYLTLPSLLVR